MLHRGEVVLDAVHIEGLSIVDLDDFRGLAVVDVDAAIRRLYRDLGGVELHVGVRGAELGHVQGDFVGGDRRAFDGRSEDLDLGAVPGRAQCACDSPAVADIEDVARRLGRCATGHVQLAGRVDIHGPALGRDVRVLLDCAMVGDDGDVLRSGDVGAERHAVAGIVAVGGILAGRVEKDVGTAASPLRLDLARDVHALGDDGHAAVRGGHAGDLNGLGVMQPDGLRRAADLVDFVAVGNEFDRVPLAVELQRLGDDPALALLRASLERQRHGGDGGVFAVLRQRAVDHDVVKWEFVVFPNGHAADLSARLVDGGAKRQRRRRRVVGFVSLRQCRSNATRLLEGAGDVGGHDVASFLGEKLRVVNGGGGHIPLDGRGLAERQRLGDNRSAVLRQGLFHRDRIHAVATDCAAFLPHGVLEGQRGVGAFAVDEAVRLGDGRVDGVGKDRARRDQGGRIDRGRLEGTCRQGFRLRGDSDLLAGCVDCGTLDRTAGVHFGVIVELRGNGRIDKPVNRDCLAVRRRQRDVAFRRGNGLVRVHGYRSAICGSKRHIFRRDAGVDRNRAGVVQLDVAVDGRKSVDGLRTGSQAMLHRGEVFLDAVHLEGLRIVGLDDFRGLAVLDVDAAIRRIDRDLGGVELHGRCGGAEMSDVQGDFVGGERRAFDGRSKDLDLCPCRIQFALDSPAVADVEDVARRLGRCASVHVQLAGSVDIHGPALGRDVRALLDCAVVGDDGNVLRSGDGGAERHPVAGILAVRVDEDVACPVRGHGAGDVHTLGDDGHAVGGGHVRDGQRYGIMQPEGFRLAADVVDFVVVGNEFDRVLPAVERQRLGDDLATVLLCASLERQRLRRDRAQVLVKLSKRHVLRGGANVRPGRVLGQLAGNRQSVRRRIGLQRCRAGLRHVARHLVRQDRACRRLRHRRRLDPVRARNHDCPGAVLRQGLVRRVNLPGRDVAGRGRVRAERQLARAERNVAGVLVQGARYLDIAVVRHAADGAAALRHGAVKLLRLDRPGGLRLGDCRRLDPVRARNRDRPGAVLSQGLAGSVECGSLHIAADVAVGVERDCLPGSQQGAVRDGYRAIGRRKVDILVGAEFGPTLHGDGLGDIRGDVADGHKLGAVNRQRGRARTARITRFRFIAHYGLPQFGLHGTDVNCRIAADIGAVPNCDCTIGVDSHRAIGDKERVGVFYCDAAPDRVDVHRAGCADLCAAADVNIARLSLNYHVRRVTLGDCRHTIGRNVECSGLDDGVFPDGDAGAGNKRYTIRARNCRASDINRVVGCGRDVFAFVDGVQHDAHAGKRDVVCGIGVRVGRRSQRGAALTLRGRLLGGAGDGAGGNDHSAAVIAGGGGIAAGLLAGDGAGGAGIAAFAARGASAVGLFVRGAGNGAGRNIARIAVGVRAVVAGVIGIGVVSVAVVAVGAVAGIVVALVAVFGFILLAGDVESDLRAVGGGGDGQAVRARAAECGQRDGAGADGAGVLDGLADEVGEFSGVDPALVDDVAGAKLGKRHVVRAAAHA